MYWLGKPFAGNVFQSKYCITAFLEFYTNSNSEQPTETFVIVLEGTQITAVAGGYM